ncbi:MAG: 50S ribosomal protein L24 [Promethearchaeota archaeon]
MRVKSKLPRKQRKALFKAPLHHRQKLISSHLSIELREELGIRSLPVRKGDTVIIMRGALRDVEGKVTEVNLKKLQVFVDGATRDKADGTTVNIPIHPSNLMIIKLDLKDKQRKAILERKATRKEEIFEE